MHINVSKTNCENQKIGHRNGKLGIHLLTLARDETVVDFISYTILKRMRNNQDFANISIRIGILERGKDVTEL